MAAAIRKDKGIEAVPEPGTHGQFDVIADGRVVFSKKDVGRFPEEEEILQVL